MLVRERLKTRHHTMNALRRAAPKMETRWYMHHHGRENDQIIDHTWKYVPLSHDRFCRFCYSEASLVFMATEIDIVTNVLLIVNCLSVSLPEMFAFAEPPPPPHLLLWPPSCLEQQ